MEVHPPLDDPVCGADIIAAAVGAVAAVQRHVHVADEMDEKGQSLEPDMGRQVLVGEQRGVAVNLDRHAISIGAGALEIERLADIDILVMPG